MSKLFKIVFLIGMPGVGKTYYGQYAAQKLGINFIDLDNEIEKKYNLSIAEIFTNLGEAKFRKIEQREIKSIIRQSHENTIISTGGGTPCYNNIMDLMNESGCTVWLQSNIEYLVSNLIRYNQERPLLKGLKKRELEIKLKEMLIYRTQFYHQSVVNISVYRGLSPDLFTNSLHLSTFAI